MTITVTNNTIFRQGGGADRVLAQVSRPWLQACLKLIRDAWRKGVKVDTEAMRRSVRYRTRQRGAILEGEVDSSLSAARVIADEEGKKAGGKMMPPGTLLRSGWLTRHGFEATMTADFLVNRAQARDGREGTHAAAKAYRRFGGLLSSRTHALQTSIATRLSRGA